MNYEKMWNELKKRLTVVQTNILKFDDLFTEDQRNLIMKVVNKHLELMYNIEKSENDINKEEPE